MVRIQNNYIQTLAIVIQHVEKFQEKDESLKNQIMTEFKDQISILIHNCKMIFSDISMNDKQNQIIPRFIEILVSEGNDKKSGYAQQSNSSIYNIQRMASLTSSILEGTNQELNQKKLNLIRTVKSLYKHAESVRCNTFMLQNLLNNVMDLNNIKQQQFQKLYSQFNLKDSLY